MKEIVVNNFTVNWSSPSIVTQFTMDFIAFCAATHCLSHHKVLINDGEIWKLTCTCVHIAIVYSIFSFALLHGKCTRIILRQFIKKKERRWFSDLCYVRWGLIVMQNCCIQIFCLFKNFECSSCCPLNSLFIELTYNAII